MKSWDFWQYLTPEQKDKLLEQVVSQNLTLEDIARILDIKIEI